MSGFTAAAVVAFPRRMIVNKPSAIMELLVLFWQQEVPKWLVLFAASGLVALGRFVLLTLRERSGHRG